MPTNPEANLSIRVDAGTGRQPQKQASLVVDRKTGMEVEWESFHDRTPGRQARTFVRFLHTGEVYGIMGQTIAGLVSLGAAFLVWTGLWLSWRRYRAWSRRKRDAKQRVKVAD